MNPVTKREIIKYLQDDISLDFKKKILDSLKDQEVKTLYAVVLSSGKNEIALKLLGDKRAECLKNTSCRP